jgi:hypothetical protein
MLHPALAQAALTLLVPVPPGGPRGRIREPPVICLMANVSMARLLPLRDNRLK